MDNIRERMYELRDIAKAQVAEEESLAIGNI